MESTKTSTKIKSPSKKLEYEYRVRSGSKLNAKPFKILEKHKKLVLKGLDKNIVKVVNFAEKIKRKCKQQGDAMQQETEIYEIDILKSNYNEQSQEDVLEVILINFL